MRQGFTQAFQFNVGTATVMFCERGRAYQELCVDVFGYPLGKIRRGDLVHRYCHGAAQHAAQECGHPFRGIVSPEHHPIALADPSGFQLADKPERQLGDLAIAPPKRLWPPAVYKGCLVTQFHIQLRELGKRLHAGNFTITAHGCPRVTAKNDMSAFAAGANEMGVAPLPRSSQ